MFGLFGKKKENNVKAASNIPVQAVEDLMGKGLDKKKIVEVLTKNGYSVKSIMEAFDQVSAKKDVLTTDASPVTPQFRDVSKADLRPDNLPEETNEINFSEPRQANQQESQKMSMQDASKPGQSMSPESQGYSDENLKLSEVEKTEALVEAIVEEKIADIMDRIEEAERKMEKSEDEDSSVTSDVQQLKTRVDDLAKEFESVIEDNRRRWEEVRIELSAMEKALHKLIPSLASSIRDLKEKSPKKKA